MEIKYYVGIDFGHGDTAAWVIPADNAITDRMPAEGTFLRLRNGSRPDEAIIWSCIYSNPDGSYVFANEAKPGASPHMYMKCSPAELLAHKSKGEAWGAFAREVVKKLLSLNTELKVDPKEGPNFILCMACPTRWNEQEKAAYLEFFNKALRPLRLQFSLILNESDAAYFTHGYNAALRRGVSLVIDYGSSTIDFTVMADGRKVSSDEWSNAQLGASAIDRLLRDECRNNTDEYCNYQKNLAELDDVLHRAGYRNDLVEHLMGRIRNTKEATYTEGKDCFSLEMNLASTFFDRNDPAQLPYFKKLNRLRFGCDVSLNKVTENYRAEVRDCLLSLRENIASVTAGQKVNHVVLSGSAFIMEWVRELVKEVFADAEIIYDLHPGYVVARGAALYAAARDKASRKLHEQVEKIDFGSIYCMADRRASAKSIAGVCRRVAQEQHGRAMTGEALFGHYADAINSLNPDNRDYVDLLHNEINEALTQTMRTKVTEVMKEVFHHTPDLSGEQVAVSTRAFYWTGNSFAPGSGLYNIFSKLFDESIGCFWAFNMDKWRDSDKINEILDGVTRRAKPERFDLSFIAYDEDDVRRVAEDARQQTRLIARRLLDNHQLFHTWCAR